ncbi:Predicted arabinose efflux permease, MFS family [Gracilibacillus orientalis]|uniref:Predicted arabinose efflux permease, MFS family n=1 Tax=Gracilibacillus orientalis TaxID=334253 RepID=A0A1I4K3P9_9BACI|nr:MFS transporter [Gracilibacillus orientalis]SFL73398.1 Predicted arabinose efflux permease, MFS family [Gracilibacillus orientalis]
MTHVNNKMWSLSFIFIVISNALVFMIFEMLLPTLPLFVTAIGGEASQVGLVTGVFMLSAIFIRPFAGILATKFDKKLLLILGTLIIALSTGAYYLSTNITMLLLVRLIHGAGFGLATTYFTTVAAEIIPSDRRGEGIGYFGAGETIAISVGPMIGMMTLELYDFQRLFFGGMAIMFLAVIMAAFIKRGSNSKELDKRENIKFKLWEKKVLFPAMLIFLIGIAAGGIMSFFSLYAIEKDFDKVGLFFLLIAAASLVIRLVSGKLFDIYGPSVILIPGSILSIIGLVLLYVAASDSTFFIAAIFYGFGFGSIFPAIQTWCMNLVDEHEHESAMASFFNFFDLGIGGGSFILGLMATVSSYQAVYGVTTIVYGIFLLIYVVSIAIKGQSEKNSGKSDQVSSF